MTRGQHKGWKRGKDGAKRGIEYLGDKLRVYVVRVPNGRGKRPWFKMFVEYRYAKAFWKAARNQRSRSATIHRMVED